ncbi:MAG: fibronectin type III domain-containing protein, partial [Candidatus Helarchaeales archaeon]
IAIDSNDNLHVVWEDSTDYNGAGTDADIFYRSYNATADEWNMTIVVSTESTEGSYSPVVAVDKIGNVHIAWTDETAYGGANPSYVDIFYKFLNASTGLWNLTQVLSNESNADADSPDITVDPDNNVHVTWYESTDYLGAGSDDDIFYKLYNASTDTWNATDLISTESTDESYGPSIASDPSGNLIVVWEDSTNYKSSGSDFDIFYKIFNKTQGTWSDTEVLSTESTGHSYTAAVTINPDGCLIVVWEDKTNLNDAGNDQDIFLKKSLIKLENPVLNPILPNTSTDGVISLNWTSVPGAARYYIYRSTANITSISNMTTIAKVSVNQYNDSINTDGVYYYVIVAVNASGNSSISNCELVTVNLPSPPSEPTPPAIVPALVPGFEFILIMMGIAIIMFLHLRSRKYH